MTFTCPRCRKPAEAPTYGPCSPCRAELRQTMRYPIIEKRKVY